MTEKRAFFFIDDVIWCMRDLTRKRPDSIFDLPFLGMLKEAHDRYGLTVQLNLFYRTDFFYGEDEFTLAQMTDVYKAEWEANSHWLKLAFHGKQEFPDYPYVNADYEDVRTGYEMVVNEIRRFAGEKSISPAVIPHWLPISKEGCQALYDCGVRILSTSHGDTWDYTGDPTVLPYGHAERLLHNRKPETKLFTRKTKNRAISNSICAYNHLTQEQYDHTYGTMKAVKDPVTGLFFKKLGGGPCVNRSQVEDFKPAYEKLNGNELIGTGNHEQYFYREYFAYQPDIALKIMEMARVMHELGYAYVTAEEILQELEIYENQ